MLYVVQHYLIQVYHQIVYFVIVILSRLYLLKNVLRLFFFSINCHLNTNVFLNLIIHCLFLNYCIYFIPILFFLSLKNALKATQGIRLDYNLIQYQNHLLKVFYLFLFNFLLYFILYFLHSKQILQSLSILIDYFNKGIDIL